MRQGDKSFEEFTSQLDEIRKDVDGVYDKTDEYKDIIERLLIKLENDESIPNEIRKTISRQMARIDWDTIKIYGIHSIIKTPNDFFLGWFNTNNNEFFI